MWYANIADGESGSEYDRLATRLKPYPALTGIWQKLMSELLRDDVFFDTKYEAFKAVADEKKFPLAADYRKSYDSILLIYRTDSAELNHLQEEDPYAALYETIDSIANIRASQAESGKTEMDRRADEQLISLEQKRAHIDTLITKINDKRIQLNEEETALNATRTRIHELFQEESGKVADLLCRLTSGGCSTDDKQKQLARFKDISLDGFSDDLQKTAQKIIIETQVASAGAGYHMPSQAEMIDAFAIYLAGRVKQEAIMWFFETLTNDARHYELIKTFFPATMTLLRSNEVYEIPNMGAQWQYALSKDFLSMPRNVLTSTWMQQRWPGGRRYRGYITGFCDMADMLVKRESYREIVRTLYLADTTSVQVPRGRPQFRDFINLLYAVNTELFVPDTVAAYRLLKYEDYRSMSFSELEIMLSLIDLKYPGVFGKMLRLQDQKSGNFRLDASVTAERLRRMLGSIEVAVNRIEVVRKDFLELQKRMEGSGEKDFHYTSYSLWGSVNELLSVFDPSGANGAIFSDSMTTAQRAFGYTSRMFEVYDLITKKNFAGAVQNTIALVDTILYAGGRDSLMRIRLDKIGTVYPAGTYLADIIAHTQPVVNISIAKNGDFNVKDFNVPGLLPVMEHAKGGLVDSLQQKISITEGDSTWRGRAAITVRDDSVYISYKDGSRMLKMRTANALRYMKHHLGGYRDIMTEYAFNYRDTAIIFTKQSPVAALFFEHDRQAVKTIRKLSGFLNDAALAQGDKQLAKVVESYALPTGSYKRKRNHWQSVDLNAFAGPYVGYEKTAASKVDNNDGDGAVYGFSVPVGLSYSKTFSKAHWKRSALLPDDYILNPDKIKIRRRGLSERSRLHMSVTFSIIDIGAVVSYRLGHTADTVLPQTLRWEQLISPGVHFGIAIPSTPLAFMVGGQYTPLLRRFSANEGQQYNAWRAYAGIYFDLPLLNFWEQRRVVGR